MRKLDVQAKTVATNKEPEIIAKDRVVNFEDWSFVNTTES